MANATILPDLFFGQWARPNAGRPTLAAGLAASPTALELSFTAPLLDQTGVAPTKAVVIGITTANGYTEHFYIAAGDFDPSGLSATATARGVRLSGLDFTTGDASLVVAHVADEKVFVAVEGVYEAILNAVLRGDTISTGGTGFTIGMGADSTITIRRNTDGTEKGFLRWNTTLDKVQYSNDGSAWTSIDDAVVGYLIKMSAADTMPGYGQNKFVGAGNVTLTLLNPGGNEQLEIRVDATNVDVAYTFAEATPIGGPVSTVSADTVENTAYNTLAAGGTEATFDSGAASDITSVNLQDNLWVEAYAVSSQAYAIAGSVDRNLAQTYGTAAGAGANTGGSISIAKVDSTRFVLVYRKSTDNTVYAKVGSVDVSTKAITYGSEVSVGTQSAAAQGYTSVCLVSTDKIIVAFRDTSAANAGRARATTISGTTIAPFGTVQTFEAGATTNISIAASSTDYAVVHFADAGDSNKGKGVLLVVTGTSIAPGSAVEIDGNTSTSFVTKQITTGYILCTWIGGASTYVQARVARVSGITLDYPTAAIPVNGLAALTPSCAVIDTGTAFVGYEESASSDGKFNQIEITSDTVLTAGTQYSFNSTNNVSSVAVSKVDGRDKFVIGLRDEADSNKGNSIVFQNYDNRAKCVGLATTAVAAGASGTVRSKGLLTGLSGLTAAAVMYMGQTTTFTTTQAATYLQLGVAKDTTEIDIGILYTPVDQYVYQLAEDVVVNSAVQVLSGAIRNVPYTPTIASGMTPTLIGNINDATFVDFIIGNQGIGLLKYSLGGTFFLRAVSCKQDGFLVIGDPIGAVSNSSISVNDTGDTFIYAEANSTTNTRARIIRVNQDLRLYTSPYVVTFAGNTNASSVKTGYDSINDKFLVLCTDVSGSDLQIAGLSYTDTAVALAGAITNADTLTSLAAVVFSPGDGYFYQGIDSTGGKGVRIISLSALGVPTFVGSGSFATSNPQGFIGIGYNYNTSRVTISYRDNSIEYLRTALWNGASVTFGSAVTVTGGVGLGSLTYCNGKFLGTESSVLYEISNALAITNLGAFNDNIRASENDLFFSFGTEALNCYSSYNIFGVMAENGSTGEYKKVFTMGQLVDTESSLTVGAPYKKNGSILGTCLSSTEAILVPPTQ